MKKNTLVVVTVISLAALGSSLGRRNLWAPDEPRYAEIAREMMIKKSFFLPYLNDEVYYNKPPFFFWSILAASLPFGEVTDTSARIPSVLFSIGMIVLVYLWVRRYQPGIPSHAAPLVLLTAFLFWWFGQRANIDACFAFFITAAVLAFHHGFHTAPGRFSTYYAAGFLAVGIGLIVKGPFALVPLVVWGVYIRLERGDLRKNLLLIIPGMLFILMPVALWLAPAIAADGMQYLQKAVFHQVGGRIVSSYSHPHPFYYYLYMFPLNFLPWAFFFLATLYELYKQRDAIDVATKYALLWSGVFLGVISLVSAKQSRYMLPMFPAAAVITARYLSFSGSRAIRIARVATLGVLVPAFAAAPVAAYFKLPDLLPAALLIAGVSLAGLFFSWRAVAARRPEPAFFLRFSGTMIACFCLANLVVMPRLNPVKTHKTILRKYFDGYGDYPLGVYAEPFFNYPFFVKHRVEPLRSQEELAAFIQGNQRKFVVMRAKYFERLPLDIRDKLDIVDHQRMGHRNEMLLKTKGAGN